MVRLSDVHNHFLDLSDEEVEEKTAQKRVEMIIIVEPSLTKVIRVVRLSVSF